MAIRNRRKKQEYEMNVAPISKTCNRCLAQDGADSERQEHKIINSERNAHHELQPVILNFQAELS